MDILPILSTLKRHKTAAGLIVLQIALTCAIVCNALFLISERLDRINAPSGMPDQELLALSVAGMRRVENPDVQTRSDVQALRQLAGVKSVTLLNQVPFGNNFSVSGVRSTPGNTQRAVGAADYRVYNDWLPTLGLRLIEGRDFQTEEYVDDTQFSQNNETRVPAVIINKALAERLFKGESAVGKSVYILGDTPQRVVGVLESFISPHPGGQDDANRYTIVLPVRPSYRSASYVLRVDAAQRDSLLKAAATALDQGSSDIKRVVRDQVAQADARSNFYRQDRSMVWLLGGVCLGLLAVTAFGIVGLASFWVQQRTRMIGTRRALGATQGQILRYFQTENFLLSSVGIVLGMIAAYGISLALMQHYEMPRLPWSYLPIGALVLWSLGQLAVLAPARRAAALPPVAALRGG